MAYGTNNCRRKESMSFFNLDYIVSILTLLLMVAVSSGDNEDWQQKCHICHCTWNSGMRLSDCKNKNFTSIPTELSSQIQVLDLSNNLIPEIGQNEFYDANLEHLHRIFLKNCSLQALHRDSLKGLTILIELDLSYNHIQTLYPGTFNGTERLRKVLLNNNEIEVLENGLFQNLTFLRRVELKNNRIKRIELHSFVNLTMLNYIYLDSNRLSLIRKETFENMPALKELSLTENPWICTCELRPFRDFTFNRNFNKTENYCQEPEHLRGKSWSDIPSEHFACRPRIIQPRMTSGSGVGGAAAATAIGAGGGGGTAAATTTTGVAIVKATTENVTLTCRIRGSPKPTVLWIYNKRPINLNDHRLQVRNSIEPNRREYLDLLVSDLNIYGVRPSDKGSYICIAENRGGKDEAEMQLLVNSDDILSNDVAEASPNLLFIICIVIISLILLLSIVLLVLCCYCKQTKKYTKDTTMSENGLILSKMEKTQNGSVLEGSVIMEMQKSLLTEVNPVEKPPRRTDIETVDTDDGHEIKKTLLDETPFGSHDEETHSVTLSDTTPRSRQTFVEDGYGANLPPDLLAFPARVPQSPSLQSSMSNIPDSRLYGKSPLSSPVYQHVNPNGIYGATPAAFRTLQHPKTRNVAIVNGRNQSPFIPAPVVYPQVVMKQGYMTIPRKPRVPSWTPSNSTALSEFQPSNPSTGTASTDIVGAEPVYDNLGLRTTAGGNSVFNLNKLGNSNQPAIRYTMKDRPLPATPNTSTNAQGGANSSTKIYEPIHDLANSTMTSDTEPLYGTAKSKSGVTIVPSTSSSVISRPGTEKISKIPPRPPPKPKKKVAVTSSGQGSTSQLFQDEGEDGTEV